MKTNDFDTLLCFTDGNELHIVKGSIILNPYKRIVLVSDELSSDYVDSIKDILKTKDMHCDVSIWNQKKYREDNRDLGSVAVLVNNCTNFSEYRILLNEMQDSAKLFFADVSEGQVYSLSNDIEEPVEGGPIELEVDEVLEIEGFDIENSTEGLMGSPQISDMLSFVKEDTKRFEELRQRIKNNYVPNGDWIEFGTRFRIDYSEHSVLRSFVAFLDKNKYVKERIVTRNRLHLNIPDPFVRSFIQTTGLWLEALTYRIINNLPFIDDTKAAVRFLWGHQPCGIVNEIDVMAVADSRMVLVSCKDMENVSTSMLNELEVYSKRIAGSRGVKLFVTAKKPVSSRFFERAEAMGINIIWLGNDVERFANIIKMVLERELG